jgi:hypothetical protein
MAEHKRGRLGRSERNFIVSNVGRLSVDEIAAKINRTAETVAQFIRLNVKPADAKSAFAEDEIEQVEIRQSLRGCEKWKRLTQELTKEEITFFEEEYIKLMTQFKGDVLATEETQVFDAIKLEILKSRNMIERRKARDDITRLEKMQEDFLSQFGGNPSNMDDDQKTLALNMESQIQAARSAEASRTNDYVKLQERLDALMRTMKATRDQRVKQIEQSKISFLGLIKMLQDREVQASEGRQMELMNMATDKEYDRLGRPTKYDDGNEDSPILSAETVDLGPLEDGDAEGDA